MNQIKTPPKTRLKIHYWFGCPWYSPYRISDLLTTPELLHIGSVLSAKQVYVSLVSKMTEPSRWSNLCTVSSITKFVVPPSVADLQYCYQETHASIKKWTKPDMHAQLHTATLQNQKHKLAEQYYYYTIRYKIWIMGHRIEFLDTRVTPNNS